MSTFVGRSSELGLLRARLAKAASGVPQTIVVEGAPGVGKTSLVRAFVAPLDGRTVLAASGDQGETYLRFGVLEQLLGPRDDGWADPFAAGADLLRLLDQRPAGDPTVFVVEDAHLADPESMAALTFALRRLRADRVMALFVARAEDSGTLPAGLLKLAEAQEARLLLEGFTDDDVAALGSALGHAHLSRGAVARLRRHTGGNPLYLRALMRELGTEVLEAPGPLPAPQSYALLVQRLVASQPEPARRLARAAAVLADHSPLSVAAAVGE